MKKMNALAPKALQNQPPVPGDPDAANEAIAGEGQTDMADGEGEEPGAGAAEQMPVMKGAPMNAMAPKSMQPKKKNAGHFQKGNPHSFKKGHSKGSAKGKGSGTNKTTHAPHNPMPDNAMAPRTKK